MLTENVVRSLTIDEEVAKTIMPQTIDREWLVTNGLGGYASMGLNGSPLRKYHGILVAALPVPLGRTIMLNYVDDYVVLPGSEKVFLSQIDLYDQPIQGPVPLKRFRLENGLPIWRYESHGFILEKRVFMGHMQNTTHVVYELIEASQPLQLVFNPYFDFRHHEASPKNREEEHFETSVHDDRFYEVICPHAPSVFLTCSKNAIFSFERSMIQNIRYRYEEERGYDSRGDLTRPGYFAITLAPGEKVDFIASTESLDMLKAISSAEALQAENDRRRSLVQSAVNQFPSIAGASFASELIMAGDQFIILPFSRLSDVAWTRAAGGEARTIIAGYHWFTDWGRDTMISLEGLTLMTGRLVEAGYILRTYCHHLREGLIPNMFPDGEKEGIYNTVDATFWFFHALDRYLHYSGDQTFVKDLLPKIKEIIQCHRRGTLFGIRVDQEDGLVNQGKEGYALTWMDAVVDGLVVTPRRGKAVEINALWYNALCLAIEWMQTLTPEEDISELQALAKQCYESFNRKFWNEETQFLFDIVEGEQGNDPACRPNQMFSISLKYPVLQQDRWQAVLKAVHDKLVTPFGIRTLSADHPNYKVAYQGNLFLRDSAYHQGTVWVWLIGPFLDAWLKANPDKKKQAHVFLERFETHLSDGGIGTINEIFDAEKPFTHRGCIAQAWSVAEIYRCWVKTLEIGT